jgi:hypothetical protein
MNVTGYYLMIDITSIFQYRCTRIVNERKNVNYTIKCNVLLTVHHSDVIT